MSPHTGAGRTPSKIWSGAQTYLGTDRGGDLGEDVKTISRPTPATPPAAPSPARQGGPGPGFSTMFAVTPNPH